MSIGIAGRNAKGIVGWARELADHRDLLFTVTQREIKIKYKQSAMGFLWAILMPVIIVGAGILVKVGYASLSGSKFSVQDLASVSVKAVPWAFFVSSIRFASLSLISNSNLVTKIYMPREIFPFAAVCSQLVDLLVASVALAIILPVLGLHGRAEQLWIIPLVLMLVLFATGAGLFLSAASLFFRDVKYIVEVFITFAIFFTPVFYDVSMFGRWSKILMLNPVAPILEAMRAAVVGGPFPSVGWLAYSASFAVLGFILALSAFKRLEPYFAESV